MRTDLPDRLRIAARLSDGVMAELLVEAADSLVGLCADVLSMQVCDEMLEQHGQATEIPQLVPTKAGYELQMNTPMITALCDRLELLAVRRRASRGEVRDAAGARELHGELEFIAAKVIQELHEHAWPILEGLAEEAEDEP